MATLISDLKIGVSTPSPQTSLSPHFHYQMGTLISKSRRTNLRASSNASRTPCLPQELLDEIIGHLTDDFTSLRRCAIAATAFVPSCRRHFFRRIVFRPHNIPTRKATFPDPSTSPAAYTHEIRIHLAPGEPIRLAE